MAGDNPMKGIARYVVAAVLGVAATDANAAVLRTDSFAFSVPLTFVQQDLTGTNGFTPTLAESQLFSVPKFDASDDLISVTATLSAQITYSYAVSQFGGTANQFIAMQPLNINLAAFAGTPGLGTLASVQQPLLNTVVCTGQANGDPCFDAEFGSFGLLTETVTTFSAALAMLEGVGLADIGLMLRVAPQIIYNSDQGDGDPTFAYAGSFTATGTLNLIYEGRDKRPDVPEPAAIALLAGGLAGLGLARRRRRVSAASAS